MSDLTKRLRYEADRLEPPSSFTFNERGEKTGLHPTAYLFRQAADALEQSEAHAEALAVEVKRVTELHKGLMAEADKRLEQAEAERNLAIKGSCNQMIRAEALQDKLDKAERERDAAREDADRYRWLRDKRARPEYREDGWEGAMWGVHGLHDPDEKGFDASIDAARKEP